MSKIPQPSCTFCDSSYHVTLCCDIYVSVESRKEIARFKNFCEFCLNSVPCKPLPGRLIGNSCLRFQKCYICFAQKNHNSAFCPEENTAPKMFLPANIDKILLPRFLAFCNATEKHSLIISFPENLKYAYLKPLKVMKELSISYNEHATANDIAVTNEIELIEYDLIDNDAILKNIVVKAKSVNIYILKISSKEFFCLLSSNTRKLVCSFLTLTSKITFAEIIEQCPNIEDLQLLKHGDVVIETSWPKDLLKYQKGNNFQNLDITIESIEFNVKSLVEFINTKCNQRIRITFTLHMPLSNLHKCKEVYQILEEKLSSIFGYVKIYKYPHSQYLNVYIAKRKFNIDPHRFLEQN